MVISHAPRRFIRDTAMAERVEWNRGLVPIEPLIEYSEREMGQRSGRLLVAWSLLVDLEDSHGWAGQDGCARASVQSARLLVASVLRLVAAAQAGQGNEHGTTEAINAGFRHLATDSNGGDPSERLVGIMER
jgi:hypothetical protein